jgi:RecA-family ATPase
MSGLSAIRWTDLGSVPPPAWLIADTIATGSAAVLGGRSSSGKSFLALAWACCIATGVPWCGREVIKMPVLYVVAEGMGGFPDRIRAWQADCYDGKPIEDLHLVTGPIRLGDRSPDYAELVRLVTELKIGLVVIDTFALCFAGEENSNSDVNDVYRGLAPVREAGATVLLVAHTTTNDDRLRGATALADNADVVFHTQVSDSGRFSLECTKRKDGIAGHEGTFRLKPVGESCVLERGRG